MYMLPAREIPMNDSYDVIVLGGGPSGCAAAAAAAREGAKTLLIEQAGFLGGMGTGGLVPFWCGFDNGGPLCNTGIGKTVFETLRSEMKVVTADTKGLDRKAIDAEALKRVYDDLVTGAGADVLFFTQLAWVDAAEGSVNAVVVCNKSGLTAYRAKVYCDTSGDADLAVQAGGRYMKGNEYGEMQPATMCFTLTNVHAEKRNGCHITLKDREKYPLIVDDHQVDTVVGEGAVGFNAGHMYDVDSTDPVNVSAAMMRGRRLVKQLVQCIRDSEPEVYGDAFLANTASLAGARESRRMICDHMVTIEDFVNRSVYPDEIARSCYGVDVHSTPGEEKARREGRFTDFDKYNGRGTYKPGESFGIPYRCLTPVGLKNVIVAGRTICSDRGANGSVRVMAPCLATGEAAGIAASMAQALPEKDFRAVNVNALRERLKAWGAFIL